MYKSIIYSMSVLFFIFIVSVPLKAQVTFSGVEHLGKPTNNSITINIVPDDDIDVYYEYGTSPGNYTNQTSAGSASAGEPYEIVISSLNSDTRYYYRMAYSTDGGLNWTYRSEYTFITQRPAGEEFVFTITSDSHVNVVGLGVLSQWQQALNLIAADQPDLHLDLGDTFPMDNVNSAAQADANYLFQRAEDKMGIISHSTPIFLSPGNHENEEGWNFDDTYPQPIYSINARKRYFPNPIPDGFYTGNSDVSETRISGDHLREDYYAWEWGDALFIVFDPFEYTMSNPYGATAGEGNDDPASGDRWNWTLGQDQYDWLKQTLENSTAKYKFMFAHHQLGGTQNYVRQGAVPAPWFEWGGNTVDGSNQNETWEFDTKRPGMSDPIHQLMIDNGVSAFFHGHDHQFVHEERDGIVYQEVPSPSMNNGYGFDLYDNSPYVQSSGGILGNLPNSGYLRVTVNSTETTVEYVRSYPQNVVGDVSYSYTIAPNVATGPTISVSGTPLSDFSSEPGSPSEEQSYTVSGSNLTGDITIDAPADFEISSSGGGIGFGSQLILAESAGSVSATTIYVRFNRGTEGTSSGSITHNSENAGQKDVAVNGTAVVPDPHINITGTPLNNFSSGFGQNSEEQSYSASGDNLTDDISISAPTDFQISTNSGSGFGSSVTLTAVNGSVASTPVYVRFNRATPGTSSGNINHTSNGATQQNVAVSGTATNSSPSVSNIPDQGIAEGGSFNTIILDSYVSDNDHNDNQITWTASSTTNLDVSIVNRVATITVNDADWNGEESVTFTATDPYGAEDSDQATFTVTAVNDPPSVLDIPDQEIAENQNFADITLDNFVTDVDNNANEITWTVSPTTNIDVIITNRVATITVKDGEWSGQETVSFTATDPSDSTDSDDVTFKVNAVNDPPVVSDIPDQEVDEGHGFTNIILDNFVSDADNDGDEMTWTVSPTTNIGVTISNRVATISINDADWNGEETVTFTATDPGDSTGSDNATFTVRPVNDPPVISDIPDQEIKEGESFVSIDLDNFVNDVDNNATEMEWSSSATSNITILITNRVATIAINDAEWNGEETVIFTVMDPSDSAASDDVTFSVTPVNDAPVVADILNQQIQEGGDFVPITLDNFVNDVDNEDSEIVWTVSPTTYIDVEINDRIATITPKNEEWNGNEMVTFTATDPGTLSDNDNATFTVSGINDAPVVADIPDQEIAEGGTFAMITLDDFVDDADNDDNQILWSVSNTTNITVVITDRVATITVKDSEWNGNEAARFTATDPGDSTDFKDVMFTVTPVNDAPVVSDIPDQEIAEGGTFATIILDNFVEDVDNEDTEINWTVSPASNITITIDERVASITVNDSEWNGDETVTFSAKDPGDSTASDDVTFTVTAENDPPLISPISDWSLKEDDSLQVSIETLYTYVEDKDNPDESLSYIFKPGKTVIVYENSGMIVVKGPADWHGTDTLQVKVSDGEFADSAKIVIEVRPQNDTPYFVNLPDTISFLNTSDTTLTMDQFSADIDLPEDSLRWQIKSSDALLILEFDYNTSDLHMSAPGFVGVEKVYCTITDDSSAMVTDSFYVEVLPVPTAIETFSNAVPVEYALSQNFPNPFNPSTAINFALPKATHAKINVYNIRGQKVIILWDGYKQAGHHSVVFNGAHLSSGIYFYSMQTNDFNQVKKMLLLK